MPKLPLTIPEAAKALSVSDRTIRRMLDEGALKEASRDKRGRILITASSVEAAAVAMGRKVVAREEVAEIAPALNAASEASLTAINAFADVVREQNQRIFELQQRIVELEFERKQLPDTSRRMVELEAENARLRDELSRLANEQTPAAQDGQQMNLSRWERFKRRLGNG